MTNDNEIFWPDGEPEYLPKGGFKEVIDGVHHCVLKGCEMTMITSGLETLKGCRQIIWKWQVLDGVSKGAGVWHSTPIEGYFMSKTKPGERVNASCISKMVVAALDPVRTNFKSFDPTELIGREVEINLLTKNNPDGTKSLWAAKVIWIRPWMDEGGAGPNLSNEPSDAA